MKIVKIAKVYERKLSRDYQTVLYQTMIEAEVEVNSDDPATLKMMSDAVFKTARQLTLDDIQSTQADLPEPKQAPARMTPK